MDAQSEPLRVVGVGDMSGDVFGNGMLQSRSTCLVAAFDHRDVFIDPTPDAGRSFAERERLSRLEHAGVLDRDVEALPTEEELSRRKQAGAGLSRPELAGETARGLSEVAGCYWAARQVMAVDNSFADVDALGWSLSGPGEEALRGRAGGALDRLARSTTSSSASAYRRKWPPGLGAWPRWPRWASWPRRPGPRAARWKWRWTPTLCSKTAFACGRCWGHCADARPLTAGNAGNCIRWPTT
jgi:hypothetical protein